ncbi:MAG: heterodisulfide reductase-related iron-sulfur binding cluster [Thermodesulfobacteriota bacterium]
MAPRTPTDAPPPTAALFVTCLADALLHPVAQAARKTLANQGVRVSLPPAQVCCGNALYKAGHVRRAAEVGAAWTRAFAGAGAGAIVSPSGSCVAHLRRHLPELLSPWPGLAAQAKTLAERTFELSQYLHHCLGLTALTGARAPGRPWAYHASCGLHRALGEEAAPLALLGALPGRPRLTLPRPERCCGFGGPFSLSHPELSGALLSDKLAAAAEAGAEVLVVGDVGCLLHLQAGADRLAQGVEVVHLAQILAGEVD